MKTAIIIPFICLLHLHGVSQSISLTFSGTGEAMRIDSIRAANLTANRGITMPGYETLILDTGNGSSSDLAVAEQGAVFPNPFCGQTIFSTSCKPDGAITLTVHDLAGRILSAYRGYVGQGRNQFMISMKEPGMYSVCLNTGKKSDCHKMICITSNQPVNSINRLDTGIGQNSNTPDLSESGLKSQKAGHLLPYTLGDVLQFTCFSGDYTTIKTDSPSGSVNYEIEFTKCSDDDGRNYSVVNIGAQTWMAENLAYLPKVSSPAEESDRSPYLYIYDYRGNDLATAKSSRNYSTYGVLYNWPAAVLLCPSGWHLPSDAEWDVLRQTTGTEPGRKLKENGTVHWISPNEGASNASGLTILPGGIRQEGHAFGSLGSAARFWSSTDCEDSIALGLSLDSGNDTVVMVYRRKSAGFSVRCVKNQDNPAVLPAVNTYTVTGITTITAVGGGNVVPGYSEERVIERGICWSTARNPTTADNKISAGSGLGVFRCDITGLSANTLYWAKAYATNSAGTGYGRELSFMTLDGGIFTDSRDSKSYRFVKIGSQYWMAENLAYLPEVSPPSVMSGSVPHYYVYGYEGSSPGAARAATNFSTYGVLYNWPASLSACPEGWHLPTLAEFANLISFTGGDTIAGYKMKSTGGWNTNAGENGNGDDSFGFTALPGGDLEGAGAFLNLGNYGSFWTSGADGGSNAWLWLLDNFNAGAFLHSYPRSIGISVRCLKN